MKELLQVSLLLASDARSISMVVSTSILIYAAASAPVDFYLYTAPDLTEREETVDRQSNSELGY